jgi:hypothetical protein
MKISVKNFCRGALLLPILMPTLLLPVEAGVISAVLLLSVWFAGAAYLLFALLTLVWIGRAQHQEHLGSTMWIAPLVFLPFSVTGWLLHQWLERASNSNLVVNAAELLPIAAFTLLVGYAYVLLVQFTLFVLRRMGVVE